MATRIICSRLPAGHVVRHIFSRSLPYSIQSPLVGVSMPQRKLLPTRRFFSGTSTFHADLVVNVPQMAESISEGTLAKFHKKIGDRVDADEEIASIETDKIDVAVNAPEQGVITELLVGEGDIVTVGQPLARIETGTAANDTVAKAPEEQAEREVQSDAPAADNESSPLAEKAQSSKEHPTEQLLKEELVIQPPVRPIADHTEAAPSVPQQVQSDNASHPSSGFRIERVEKLSRMRKTIATRLKQSQNICASLTTMQEVDMTALMAWRAKYKEHVAKAYDVRLGYMGAFAKAATMAARQIPLVNASIDTEKEIITYRDYVDISIAVSSPKGLVTPVVRNCESLGIIELERQIGHLAKKARDGKLRLDDLAGGNFSISNPGIFNSMFGTPLINYPQAAVFNMNTIKDRVVAVDGKAEIRPMMYITLTYDHRLIDGREAVGFLNLVKGYVEDPAKMLFEGGNSSD